MKLPHRIKDYDQAILRYLICAFGAVLISFMILYALAAGYEPDCAIKQKITGMSNDDGVVTWSNLISHSPKIYFAATFRTIDYPFKSVSDILYDIDNYEKIFKYMHKVKPVKPADRRSGIGSFYFEVRAGFARSWSILTVHAFETQSDAKLEIHASQNEDKTLNAKWRGAGGGWFSIENRDMHITWYLERIDNNKSRVGFVVWTNPTVNIPEWLFNWAAKKMVPRFIADLENRVKTSSRTHHLPRSIRRIATDVSD